MQTFQVEWSLRGDSPEFQWIQDVLFLTVSPHFPNADKMSIRLQMIDSTFNAFSIGFCVFNANATVTYHLNETEKQNFQDEMLRNLSRYVKLKPKRVDYSYSNGFLKIVIEPDPLTPIEHIKHRTEEL